MRICCQILKVLHLRMADTSLELSHSKESTLCVVRNSLSLPYELTFFFFHLCQVCQGPEGIEQALAGLSGPALEAPFHPAQGCHGCPRGRLPHAAWALAGWGWSSQPGKSCETKSMCCRQLLFWKKLRCKLSFNSHLACLPLVTDLGVERIGTEAVFWVDFEKSLWSFGLQPKALKMWMSIF